MALTQHNSLSITITIVTTSNTSSPSCERYKNTDERYINAIFCLDQLLGRFIQNLKNNDLLENTTIIITADHGVFNSPIIHELFGDNNEHQRLLGIILANNNSSIEEPVALYDLGASVLNILEIKHNVKFIFGKDFNHKNKQRTLFARKKVLQQGVWRDPKRKCQTPASPAPLIPLDYCELKNIINTVYSFTDAFSLASGISYNSESLMKISYNNGYQKILSIELNGKSLVDIIRRDGFLLNPVLLNRKGVFMVFFNPQNRKLFNFFSFNTEANDLPKVRTLLKETPDIPYIIFSNNLDESLDFLTTIKNKHNLTCVAENFCMKSLNLVGKAIHKKDAHQVIIDFSKKLPQ